MSVSQITKNAAQEFRIRSHDKKLIPLILLAAVLLRITPDDLVLSIIQSTVFQQLVALNPFATRMATYGDKPEYVLYCYGMATLLVPYFFYVMFNSPDVRNGVVQRYEKGGRGALAISALFTVVAFLLVYFIGEFNTHYSISKIEYFVFYSLNGVALLSLGFTSLLVTFFVYFLLFTTEFFRKADKS